MESAKILNFSRALKTAAKIKTPIEQPKFKTNFEVFQDASEEVYLEWEKLAAKNRLNEHFLSKLPPNFIEPNASINNLSFLSNCERKLDMKVAVFSPTTTSSNPLGWLVSFQLGKAVYSTQPTMASENVARAVCILLYLKFKYEIIKLNRELS